jgi:phosphatidylserine decarboxylase
VNRILLIQTVIVAVCIFILAEFAGSFPAPSPVIKPLLPPRERWPTTQVMAWVDSQKFDPAFVEFFYRDPERTVPAGTSPVSPADGVVQATLYDEQMAELVVGLSFWDVHVVRSPVSGVVKTIEPGGRIDFRRSSEIPKTKFTRDEDFAFRGKDAPVQAIITVATDKGDVRIRMITSYWASRLRVWVHQGERIQKGQRIGRILLGSTVAVGFPPEVRFSIRKNQRVVAGETIIAEQVGSRSPAATDPADP